MTKHRITISLDPQLLDAIRAAAKLSDGSVSSEIARCCRHALEPTGDGVSFRALGRCAKDLRRVADVLEGDAPGVTAVNPWRRTPPPDVLEEVEVRRGTYYGTATRDGDGWVWTVEETGDVRRWKGWPDGDEWRLP